jgi:hypothetical protein
MIFILFQNTFNNYDFMQYEEYFIFNYFWIDVKSINLDQYE